MKKFLSMLLCGVMAFSTFAFVGCNQPVPDTEETLEVYCIDLGYGYEWCEAILEEFQKEDWVKEKYPNLIVPALQHSNSFLYAQNKFNAGEIANTIDLYFDGDIVAFEGPSGELLELTEEVYNATVPGESVTYKEKMKDSYVTSAVYVDPANPEKEIYYTGLWADGMNSFIYNETILAALGFEIPNTTDELKAICEAIKTRTPDATYGYNYTFLQGFDENYWDNLFRTWWMQYEGSDAVYDFYNGIYNNRYSVDIFRQEGRLYAMEVMEELLDYDKEYLAHQSLSSTNEFMFSQTEFLQGKGIFCANGDWFANEMAEIIVEIEALGDMDTFKMMPMPVISELGVKLGITDAQLSAIIDYLDGDTTTEPSFTSTEGYNNAEVIERVREARSTICTNGPGHKAGIPKYAKGKEVAIDFILYMATDKAQKIYMETTGGCMLPFEYDVKTQASDIYDSFSDLQKSKHDYFEKYAVDIYPNEKSFPLNRFGYVKPLAPSVWGGSDNYYIEFARYDHTLTPQQIFDGTIDYWTPDRWANACENAGITL